MKKHLLVAAVVFAAVSAQASKARLNALGNSEHIVDIQEVFIQEPDQALNYEAATVEFGGNGSATTKAEGGFIRKMGDSAWSVYLGKNSTTFQALTDAVTALAANGVAAAQTSLRAGHEQANPLQLTYASKAGDINWGASLFHVGSDIKGFSSGNGAGNVFSGDIEQNLAGLLLGANNGTWDIQARIGLGGEMKTTGTAGLGSIAALTGATELKLESTSSLKVSGGYKMDTMYFYGGYEMGSSEVTANSTAAIDREISNSALTIGVINSHNKDGVDFFYGISAIVGNTENEDKVTAANSTDVDSTIVPMLVGVEADVTDWLVLRGSLTQNFGPLSSTKPKNGSSGSTADSTVTALGAGFKWGKATVDTVVSTGNSGNFGFDGGAGDIFGQASVTYNF